MGTAVPAHNQLKGESHENFCMEFGYELDSILGRDDYKEVVEEYKNFSRFFTEEEKETLRKVK